MDEQPPRAPAPHGTAHPPAVFALQPMLCDGDGYKVTRRISYRPEATLKDTTIELVFDFAYRMAFTKEGAHRRSRSGGGHVRRNGEIFAGTFQGKLAECAVCNFFFTLDAAVTPDFSIMGLGSWDSTDLTVEGREIAVKSTKHFGNLLLLEARDWDEQGRYIPNIEDGVCSYDCIILVRIKPSCEEILKDNRLLYCDTADKQRLWALLKDESWTYQLVGFITGDDLLQVINDENGSFIIRQGDTLNDSTTMDADNYYVQAGDMRAMSQYREFFPALP